VDLPNTIRVVSFICLLYIFFAYTYRCYKRFNNWRIYVLPISWIVHALLFYAVSILRSKFGLFSLMSVYFLNYWSQLIRFQVVVSLAIIIGVIE